MNNLALYTNSLLQNNYKSVDIDFVGWQNNGVPQIKIEDANDRILISNIDFIPSKKFSLIFELVENARKNQNNENIFANQILRLLEIKEKQIKSYFESAEFIIQFSDMEIVISCCPKSIMFFNKNLF